MCTFFQSEPTSIEPNDIFFTSINQSIEEWVELKHVIDVYGSGGSQAYEKLKWMGLVLYDYFKNYSQDLILDEIYEFVGQMIDNEFNFIPLDNSLEAFVAKLLRYYQLALANRTDEMACILQESKSKHIERQNKQAQNVDNINQLMSNVNVSRQQEQPNRREEHIENSNEDSEWTLVSKRKGRK